MNGMMLAWMSAALSVAVLVIVFVAGLKIGRLMEQDRMRAAVRRDAGRIPQQRGGS